MTRVCRICKNSNEYEFSAMISSLTDSSGSRARDLIMFQEIAEDNGRKLTDPEKEGKCDVNDY